MEAVPGSLDEPVLKVEDLRPGERLGKGRFLVLGILEYGEVRRPRIGKIPGIGNP